MYINSKSNDRIKDIKKLYEKKYRDLENKFIIEGYHLVEEAYNNKQLELVITSNEEQYKDIETINTTDEIIKYIVDLPSPQNIIGVCKKLDEKELGNKILILDNIQDPGNLGTLIRSSVAFEIDTIILSDDTVDLYNPKVIRSTQGMIFKINIIRCNLDNKLQELKQDGYYLYGTKMENGNNIKDINIKDKYCIILGNEGNGINKKYIDECNELVYIKMNSNCESLNVAVAGSIVLYELSR